MENIKQSEFFIGDFGSGLYHQPTCSMVEHIIYKIRYDSIPDAEADGYVPHICIPNSLTSLPSKILTNRLPADEELHELIDIGWRGVQSGEFTKYRKLMGKEMGELSASEIKSVTSDLIKYGLRAKGKNIVD